MSDIYPIPSAVNKPLPLSAWFNYAGDPPPTRHGWYHTRRLIEGQGPQGWTPIVRSCFRNGRFYPSEHGRVPIDHDGLQWQGMTELPPYVPHPLDVLADYLTEPEVAHTGRFFTLREAFGIEGFVTKAEARKQIDNTLKESR